VTVLTDTYLSLQLLGWSDAPPNVCSNSSNHRFRTTSRILTQDICFTTLRAPWAQCCNDHSGGPLTAVASPPRGRPIPTDCASDRYPTVPRGSTEIAYHCIHLISCVRCDHRASSIDPYESIRRTRFLNEQYFTAASLLTGIKSVCAAAVKPRSARLSDAFANDSILHSSLEGLSHCHRLPFN
jgi:hypothetical protein